MALCASAAAAAPADPMAPPRARWRVELETFYGSTLNGVTRVRENDLNGDRLRLREHLGIDALESIGLAVHMPMGSRTSVIASVERLFLWGTTELPQDRTHNATTYAANTRLTSRPDFTSIELRLRQRLWSWPGGALFGDLGAHLDYLDWHFQGTVVPGSLGHETGEGFYQQAIPIPEVGLALHQALGPSLWTEWSVRLGGARHWDSGRVEGGTVYYWESLCDARARVGWELGGGWSVGLGVRFLYLTIREESQEDGNLLRLPALGATLSVRWSF